MAKLTRKEKVFQLINRLTISYIVGELVSERVIIITLLMSVAPIHCHHTHTHTQQAMTIHVRTCRQTN